MAISEREVFTFTWRIENFTFCPRHSANRPIPSDQAYAMVGLSSPSFVVDFLSESIWNLSVYPRGQKENRNNFGFYLHRYSVSTEKIAIGFALSLLSVTGQTITRSADREFVGSSVYGYKAFCTREALLSNANGHLPNDTLTLTCKMWRLNAANSDGEVLDDGVGVVSDYEIGDCDLVTQMRYTVARDEMLNFQTQFASRQHLAVTLIKVRKKSVLWPIRRFSELRPNKKLTIPIITASKKTPAFFLTIYINNKNNPNRCLQIEIQKHPNENQDDYFVNCKIVFYNSVNSYRLKAEDEYFFDAHDENDVWKFPEFVAMKETEYPNRSNDMYLHCEFAFSICGDVHHIQTTDAVSVSSCSSHLKANATIGSAFKDVSDKELSDVILLTEEREFKAHKIVLAAQSIVFKAMFQSDMLEKNKGVVTVTDIDERTLGDMLDFMYGKDLELVELADAENLYSAADKYKILSLKSLCSCFLKSKLSVSNVCSVLNLAHLHQDDDLMYETKNFIRLNATEIFHSPIWTEFMRSNSELSGDIMLNMLKKLKL